MKPEFIYLDGDTERQQLIDRVRGLRQDVLAVADRVPETDHFLPRYDGRSLAVTLARLAAHDTVTLWLIRAASNGYTVSVPERLVRFGDQLVCGFSQRRIIASSTQSIRRKEDTIAEFIRTVPLDVLSKDVLYPGQDAPYTVEKALQVCFVHHWQQQLDLMQQADSVGKL